LDATCALVVLLKKLLYATVSVEGTFVDVSDTQGSTVFLAEEYHHTIKPTLDTGSGFICLFALSGGGALSLGELCLHGIKGFLLGTNNNDEGEEGTDHEYSLGKSEAAVFVLDCCN
jgi:hypothetical protein